MKIWVDNIRPAPAWDWVQVHSSSEAITLLDNHRRSGEPCEILSLDHDLGIIDGVEDTTRRVIIWMIENEFWPVEVRVHSANPPGAYWLEEMIARYHPGGKNNPENS